MEREGKAKVVASIWGTEFVQFLACFASVDLEEKDEFNRFFQIDRGKTDSAAKNLTNSVPQIDETTFAFASLTILLLWCM